MPNPNPTQSEAFKQKQYQRTTIQGACVPSDTPLAKKAIGIKLPIKVDAAIRELGPSKGAWLREVICRAALDDNLVEEVS